LSKNDSGKDNLGMNNGEKGDENKNYDIGGNTEEKLNKENIEKEDNGLDKNN